MSGGSLSKRRVDHFPSGATTWTTARLKQVFEQLRLRYWPRSRRLRRYDVQAASLEVLGRCKPAQRLILIDVGRHRSAPVVRSTLLHEMAHAAVGGTGGHGSKFWAQLERLLKLGARITVGFPELGESGRHLYAIPSRFTRCRRLFAPVYQREMARLAKRLRFDMPDEDLDALGYQAAQEELEWRLFWRSEARERGFVDVDGRLLPWARKHRDRMYGGYKRGRRHRRKDQSDQDAFEEAIRQGYIRVSKP